MRTLIVEDDFTSRYGLKMFLKEYGECVEAVNGQEAVKLFKASLRDKDKRFDSIFLDIMMPLMNGQEVLKEIRKLEENRNILDFDDRTKIIMLTALTDYKNIKASFSEICDGYLFKPIEKEKILEELIRLELIKMSVD